MGTASIVGAHNNPYDSSVAYAKWLASHIASSVLNGTIRPDECPPTVAGGDGSKGSGRDIRDTIYAVGSAAHTINPSGNQSGRGSDGNSVTANPTVIGGTSGKTTLFGGTDSKLTFLAGGRDASVAGASSGGNIPMTASNSNESLGGSGNAGHNTFTFMNHSAGASLVENFPGSELAKSKGCSSQELASALNHQTVGPGGVSYTLSDDTKITFADITKHKPG